MQSPFKLLDAYTIEDKEAFFGRDDEVASLAQMVNQNRLILVYGQSGTGKTSLVQCGLAGRFDSTDWLPLFIRRGENINRSFDQALENALEGELLETYPDTIEEIYALYLRPVYLVFDQFEELFILGSFEEQAEFFKKISKIVDAKLPFRIIFILREEYLAHLYDFEKVIPSLLDRRLRVESMSYSNLAKVIRFSCEKFNITFEDPEANFDQIISNLKIDKSSGFQLPYLQVYLDMLYRADFYRTYSREFESPPGEYPPLQFTGEEIDELGPIENVLQRFLKEQEIEIHRQLTAKYPELPEDAVRQILDIFVTAEGTKRPVFYLLEDEIIRVEPSLERRLSFSKEIVTDCIQALQDNRLLRADEETLELAHDSLADLIDRERSDEQRQLNDAYLRLQSGFREYQISGEPLSKRQLNSLEPFFEKLQLEPPIRQFIRESQEALEQKEKAELLRKQAELEKEQRLRGVAEKNEQRARRRSLIATLAAAIALAFLVIAIWQYYNRQALTLSIVKRSLQTGQEKVLALGYDEALAIYRETFFAQNLAGEEIGSALFEIAFFANEIGDFEQAINLTDTVAILFGKNWQRTIPPGNDTIDAVRQGLKNIDRERFDFLHRRYYPEMVTVPSGEFVMGCDTSLFPNCPPHELPQTQVRLDSFQIAETEITFWEYNLYMQATKLDSIERLQDIIKWDPVGNLPVCGPTWVDAQRYAKWLNKQLAGEEVTMQQLVDLKYESISWSGFRLPTEAEWEYAAKGGPQQDTFLYSGSDNLREVAWFGQNRPQPVGTKQPNALGIYDMSGSMQEWCYDIVFFYAGDTLLVNPKRATGPQYLRPNDNSPSFVLRDCSWLVSDSNGPVGCRVSARYVTGVATGGAKGVNFRNWFLGFRVAKSL